MRSRGTRIPRPAVLAGIVWTALAVPAAAQTVVQVTGDTGQDATWTADNTYVLNGFVFVDDGATLTIEPGTVVRGKPGQGENASALIVAQGGRIFAEGTRENPIIFTAEADDVSDPFDLPLDTRGLWGGVIILGKAVINTSTGVGAIEGIPTTEPRGAYGGTDDSDDSGVFRYVSIRYGGTDIGAGNEINGLTMGGVGSGTVVEYVEIYNNQDDGFEWFGGTVGSRYLVSAFNGDDAFDIDEGWRGDNQFWLAVQAEEIGDRAGEHDGGTDPEDGQPYATPQIWNATFIGSGVGASNPDNPEALKLRDNWGGSYFNSIFTDFVGAGVDVEDLPSGEDSRNRLEEGTLKLRNNIWWGFGAGDDLAGVADCSGDGCGDPKDDGFVQTALQEGGNRIEDPRLRGISRTTDGGLDPRPAAEGPAASGALTPPSNGFYESTSYLGAFTPSESELWIAGWTFISQLGIVVQGDFTGPDTAVRAVESSLSSAVPGRYELDNSPNPFNPSTTIRYSLPVGGEIRLSLYNNTGQELATLVQGYREAGSYSVQLSGDDLASGVYHYRLVGPSGILSRRTTLLK